ncbi:DUF3592 domain-containing protein [Pseudacidobacterium ailaaui]|jgi:hypothetical protein|uniref:DUF3592 domain-containing protein n=1 Tax=Pseudacidobacterium ailaaui TaxID=1382359 RepID=UPI0004792B81|nr:DUF3592 domain-containing protein [Pseudacidobacterium ailaaui]MBX6359128.1 hypothetical protein [Pseudacidobacterium ailaaui]MCL6464185.1 hypothetical protein [Pseudacidobacterium ailaaui]
MSSLSLRDPDVIGTLTVAALFLAGAGAWLLLRKRPSAEEMERTRRSYLVNHGRIIDGTLLDIAEVGPEEAGRPAGMHLILYKYEIGGVEYECSQDVTALRDIVNIHDCRIGFPCSVRYDTHRPENSIVVAENWSGLRDAASPLSLLRPLPRRVRTWRPTR